MNDRVAKQQKRTLVGLAPVRLATAPTRPLPSSVKSEDQDLVVNQALEWQQAAGSAVFWEMGAAGQGADEGRVYALAGQMASAGEQLALAHAAGVEVALWREVREEGESDPAHEMSMRGMAEAQCLFVMGTGHAVANVAVRALALSPPLREELGESLRRAGARPTFEPFSSRREDWVSLNADTCRILGSVARSSGSEPVVQLVADVASFGSGDSWRRLVERRGEDFHRWRPQSHGMEGVPRRSPWTRKGRTRALGLGHPSYEEAEGLAEAVATVASDAMLGVARSMEAFAERWPAASSHLGGPRFKLR